MSKETKKKDILKLDNLSVLTSIQYFGLIIGIAFSLGVTLSSFYGMKEKIGMLHTKTEELKEKITNDISISKNDLENDIDEIKKDTYILKGELKGMRAKLNVFDNE